MDNAIERKMKWTRKARLSVSSTNLLRVSDFQMEVADAIYLQCFRDGKLTTQSAVDRWARSYVEARARNHCGVGSLARRDMDAEKIGAKCRIRRQRDPS